MLGMVLTQIYVYFAISNTQSAKTFLKMAVLIKLDEIAENSLYCRTAKWADKPCRNFVRVLFWPLLGLFSSFGHNPS